MTLEYTLCDVVEQVNAFQMKMLRHGLEQPTVVGKVRRNIGDLLEPRDDWVSSMVSLGAHGFEDPRINELIDSASKSVLDRDQNGVADSAPLDGSAEEEDVVQKFHDETMRSIVSDEFKNVEQRCLDEFREQARMRWDQEKAKFMQSMELVNDWRFVFRSSPLSDDLTETYPALILRRNTSLTEIEIYFARLTHDYVPAKLDADALECRRRLQGMCARADGTAGIWEMWSLLESLLFTHWDDHLSPQWDGTALVASSLDYLEAEYCEYLRGQVAANLSSASLGGVPGVYSLVRGYLAIEGQLRRTASHILLEGKPAWQFVYLCLRCGDRKAALRAATGAGLPQSFIHHLEALSSTGQSHHSLYSLLASSTLVDRNDPYCLVCIALFDMGCDVGEGQNDVLSSIDDFLWFRLHQVRHSVGDRSFDERLQALQTQIRDDFGEKYFVVSSGDDDDATGQSAMPCPLLYFQCLLLTGQFEEGIDLLCRYASRDNILVHAVHMAIVLYQMGTLRVCGGTDDVPDDVQASPLLSSNRKLNLYKLVKTYAESRFVLPMQRNPRHEKEELTALLDYLYLLQPIACYTVDGNRQVDGFASALSSTDLNDAQMQAIYGTAPLSERLFKRSKALIDTYVDDPSSLLTLIAECAYSRAGNCPNPRSATFRFVAGDLVGASDQLLELLSFYGMLSVEFNQTKTQLDAADVLAFAEHVSQVMCERHEALLCGVRLAKYFSLFRHRQYETALNLLRDIRVVPFDSASVDDCVNRFISLPDTLQHTISDVIETCAVCMQQTHKWSFQSLAATPEERRFANSDNSLSSLHVTNNQSNGGQIISQKSAQRQVDALVRFTESVPFHVRTAVSRKLLELSTTLSV